MERWIDQREVEPGVQRGFSGIPPVDCTARRQTEAIDIGLSASNCAMIPVDESDLGVGPDRGGGDAQDSSPAAEVDDSLWRLVSGITCQCLDQGLATCIQSFCAEDAGTRFDAEVEMLAMDRFDARLEGRCVFGCGTRARLFLEANDPRLRSVGDNDGLLIELLGQTFDRRDDAEGIGSRKEKLAPGLEDPPAVHKIEKGRGTTLLQVDQYLLEAFVLDFASCGDDFQFRRLGTQISISPGLNNDSALRDHREIGLKLANFTVAQNAGIQGESFGSSVSLSGH